MTRTQRSPALSWPAKRIAQWGVLWGLLLSAGEFFVNLPLHGMPPSTFLMWWLMVWPLPLWCLLGCVMLLLARRAECSGEWCAPLLLGLVVSLAWAAYQPVHVQFMHNFLRDSTHFRDLAAGPVEMTTDTGGSLLAYNLWVSQFYGGLLVAGYVLSVRGERTRVLLREAAIARGRTEALLGELQLQTLQAQIDPALLLAALDEVQRLYQYQSDRADAVLERLVDFLRAAMPGLKDRHSSLHAELRLAEAFARLQSLMPGGARWQVEWPQDLPECEFPSLLLLPIMALADANGSPRVIVQVEDAQVSLRVQAVGRSLPADIEQSSRAALLTLPGRRFRMRANESPQTQLLIALETYPAPKEFEHEARLS